jgi:hypothetical protein
MILDIARVFYQQDFGPLMAQKKKVHLHFPLVARGGLEAILPL